MSISDAKQRFNELQEEIVNDSYWEHEEEVNNMVELLKEHPALCSDALKMIEENSDDMHYDYQETLLKSIVKIKPELFPIAQKVAVAPDKTFLVHVFVDTKDKLSEKDINLIMGQFSFKNFLKLYPRYEWHARLSNQHAKKALKFIEKVAKGNLENTEILKKCLLLIKIYDTNENTSRITNKILALQPKLKEFTDSLEILNFKIPTFPKLEKIKEKKNTTFKYTTGNSDLAQLQHRMDIKEDEKDIISPYLKQKKKEEEKMISKINKLGKDLEKNSSLNQAIHHFNALVKQVNNSERSETVYQILQVWREKLSSKIIEEHKSHGKQIQQILNSPKKLNEVLNKIDFSNDTSSILVSNIIEIAERSKNVDVLKVLSHKKEEAYGVWNYEDIRKLEATFAAKNYIVDTIYPNFLSQEEQSSYIDRDESEEEIIRKKKLAVAEKLIQAADEVVNLGDEQKKKEFNDFILAEGEPRLAELDAWVMEYLHENCTENNLNKVNALRSFYGLKVELQAGNAVDADERAAVRKVFDRTWSSYERGKNTETREPYYSEADMAKAREQAKEHGKKDPVENNRYYENSVSPAYRKYFEEHDIYEIYQNHKNDEDKKYSAENYRDLLIDKSPFKALRKHGLYNDAKIICNTLEALQVEPEIAVQFNLKDLSDMVVNSHNTFEDRKVYTKDTEEYMFTKSPHTDELDGYWRDPYYWHQYDDDDDEYNDEYDNNDYEDVSENDETFAEEKQYDEEGFEIIPDTDYYSERDEEVAARDAWWQDLSNHNPKAVKHISEAFARHGRENEAISGFWEAASYGTPGVGSRRDWRLLSATLHHAEAIQYGGNDDKKNFVGATRYYDSYGDTFDEDDMHIDYHKSFHRRDTPFDALYINYDAKSANDKLATVEKPDENAQKAFLITSFTNPHMHFYAGFRKKDQYTAPLYHMRNIEKDKQERVDKIEKSLKYLTKLGNALSSISICVSEALKTEEKIKNSQEKINSKKAVSQPKNQNLRTHQTKINTMKEKSITD
ncbi:MAG: hypothetical protein IJ099_02950 [Alphaproteobacteria bacterium]|nr:hypothetical protein [Alphaproteobacteria bacterium]